MNFVSSLVLIAILIVTPRVFALSNADDLVKNMFQKNQQILALEESIVARKSLADSAVSGYYPTLNAIGGWQQNKTDDLAATEKGVVGYLEGSWNLFRGFKDSSVSHQKDIQFKTAQLELQFEKNKLEQQFIEAASDMILLHQFQTILDEEYKLTQIQKQMAAKKSAAGLTGSVDNLEFELRENEIQIEQKQIHQKHAEAHQAFLKLFGEDISDAAIDKVNFSPIEKLTQNLPSFKIENSIEYQRAQLALESRQYERQEIKSEYLPSLDLKYSFGQLSPNENRTSDYNESKYALQLTVPLFSGFDTYYKSKSSLQAEAAAEKVKNQSRYNVESEYNILKTKITEFYFLFQMNQKKMVNTQKYFDLTFAEYKRGVKNSPDLVNATERLFAEKKRKFEILKELEVLKFRIENL
jgi:outer membrane protein